MGDTPGRLNCIFYKSLFGDIAAELLGYLGVFFLEMDDTGAARRLVLVYAQSINLAAVLKILDGLGVARGGSVLDLLIGLLEVEDFLVEVFDLV